MLKVRCIAFRPLGMRSLSRCDRLRLHLQSLRDGFLFARDRDSIGFAFVRDRGAIALAHARDPNATDCACVRDFREIGFVFACDGGAIGFASFRDHSTIALTCVRDIVKESSTHPIVIVVQSLWHAFAIVV